ncbi:hypothetical protein B0H10DRAFT_786424 [Mycena sp. CBHHK59/15]|nr:hypothetical protein B0H10DRAFT_786424 [Mycena sp. CBHHK59/15]
MAGIVGGGDVASGQPRIRVSGLIWKYPIRLLGRPIGRRRKQSQATCKAQHKPIQIRPYFSQLSVINLALVSCRPRLLSSRLSPCRTSSRTPTSTSPTRSSPPPTPTSTGATTSPSPPTPHPPTPNPPASLSPAPSTPQPASSTAPPSTPASAPPRPAKNAAPARQRCVFPPPFLPRQTLIHPQCSGDHPACSRCLARGLVCEYAKEGRVRGPNKPKTPLAAPASLPPSPHARDFPAPDKSAPRRRRNTTLAPPPPRSNAQVKPEPLSSCVPLALSGSGSGGSLKRLSLPATLDAGPYDGGEGGFGGGGGGGFNGGFEGGGYLPYPPPLQHHHAHTHHPMPALSTLALFEGAPDPYAAPYSPASYHAPGGFDSPHGSQYGGQYEHAQYDSPHGSQYEHAQYDSPHGSQYEHRGAYDSGGFDSPRAGSESESSRGSSA